MNEAGSVSADQQAPWVQRSQQRLRLRLRDPPTHLQPHIYPLLLAIIT